MFFLQSKKNPGNLFLTHNFLLRGIWSWILFPFGIPKNANCQLRAGNVTGEALAFFASIQNASRGDGGDGWKKMKKKKKRCPRNLQQDPTERTPKKTWVSNSSFATYLRGLLVRSQSIFDDCSHVNLDDHGYVFGWKWTKYEPIKRMYETKTYLDLLKVVGKSKTKCDGS